MKINLPMRNLTGPFTVELNLTRWQIKGQQGKRRRILLEA